MGPKRALLTALALALAATLALSACGGGDDAELLPGKTASAINSNLDSVEQLVAEEDCLGAEQAAAEVSAQVEDLTGVDRELKEALGRGAARLTELVGQCDEEAEETEEPAPIEEEPSEEEVQERENSEREEEKAQQRAEKAEEREQRDEEREEKESPPSGTPGQEKQEEKSETPPNEGGGTPAGGLAPSAPAEGGE